MPQKSGYVTIVGKPNVGKSTLLNQLLGKKLVPVSRKPQMTRELVHGILTREEGQIVFIDTPGLHKPNTPLARCLDARAHESFTEANVIYWLVEPRLPNPPGKAIPQLLESAKQPILILINKIDELKDKKRLLPIIEAYTQLLPAQEIIPISALKNIQVDTVLEKTFACLPEGAPLFPRDYLTTDSARDIAQELIREKVVRYTSQEIPYATACQIAEFKEAEEQVEIHATIFVERTSQRGILIGQQGRRIKQIREAAERDLRNFFEKRVALELWVKVLNEWTRDPQYLAKLGYKI